MSAPTIGPDDLGAFYIHEDGSIWKMIAYVDQPSATLQCVHSPDGPTSDRRIDGVIGAPIFDEFRRLRPDADAPS